MSILLPHTCFVSVAAQISSALHCNLLVYNLFNMLLSNDHNTQLLFISTIQKYADSYLLLPLEKVQVSYFDPQWHPTYVPSEVKFSQSCPTLCDPMNYTVHEFSRPEYWSG